MTGNKKEQEQEQQQPVVALEIKDGQITITFDEEELQGVHFLVKDIDRILQQNIYNDEGVTLTKEQFEDYLYYQRRIPILTTGDLRKDVQWTAHSWNKLLKGLLPLRDDFTAFLELAVDLDKEKEAEENLTFLRTQVEKITLEISWELANEIARELIQKMEKEK
jgi:hypothetical protein